MDLEAFIKKQLHAREARGRSPDFRAEMAKERQEFANTLKKLGERTYEAGLTVLFKAPTQLFLNTLKLWKKKKYGTEKYVGDATDIFFGKDGTVYSVAKVASTALELVGRGGKIALRELLKL